jgi:hypothetical protein
MYNGADNESIFADVETNHLTPTGEVPKGWMNNSNSTETYRFYRDGDKLVEYGGIDLPLDYFKKLDGSEEMLSQIAADGVKIENLLYRSNNNVNINCTTNDELGNTICKYYTFKLNVDEFTDSETSALKKVYSIDFDSVENWYGKFLPSIFQYKGYGVVLYPTRLPDFEVRAETVTIRGQKIPLNCTEIMIINNDIPSVPVYKNVIEITDTLSEDDINALKKLTHLRKIALLNLEISDAEFLNTFTKLETLQLDYNSIENIDFVSNMPFLDSLSLSFNPVSDVSVLAESGMLSGLDLSHTKVINIDNLPLYLSRLSLQNTGIESIDGIENLIFLTYLDICKNEISDITPIKDLHYLEEFYASNNNIENIEVLTGKHIEILGMTGNKITDFSPLFTFDYPKELHMDFDDETIEKLLEHYQHCIVLPY